MNICVYIRLYLVYIIIVSLMRCIRILLSSKFTEIILAIINSFCKRSYIHYMYNLIQLVIQICGSLIRMIKQKYNTPFFSKVYSFMFIWRAPAQKTQMAPHHKHQTPSTESPNSKNPIKDPNPKPP